MYQLYYSVFKFFQSRYCEYLALMYMWQQDYDRARHYTKMTQDKFLQVMFIELYTHYTKMTRDKFLQVMFIELYTHYTKMTRDKFLQVMFIELYTR